MQRLGIRAGRGQRGLTPLASCGEQGHGHKGKPAAPRPGGGREEMSGQRRAGGVRRECSERLCAGHAVLNPPDGEVFPLMMLKSAAVSATGQERRDRDVDPPPEASVTLLMRQCPEPLRIADVLKCRQAEALPEILERRLVLAFDGDGPGGHARAG